MGLLKKLAEKAAAGAPDYRAEIAARLPAGESVVGWGHGQHLAPETDLNMRRRGVIGAGINLASEMRSKQQHLTGAADSCAYAVPRDVQSMITLAITEQRVTLWTFGTSMREVPPRELVAFPRSSVSSITATGDAGKLGRHARLLFIDESSVDLEMMDDPANPSFWSAAAALSG